MEPSSITSGPLRAAMATVILSNPFSQVSCSWITFTPGWAASKASSAGLSHSSLQKVQMVSSWAPAGRAKPAASTMARSQAAAQACTPFPRRVIQKLLPGCRARAPAQILLGQLFEPCNEFPCI